jgi:nucleotide-binding universal stress UspA family protein
MKRILACTDLSDGAHAALVRAVALAVQAGASLYLLHAAPSDEGENEETRRAILASARSEAEAIGAGALDIHVRVSGRKAEPAILHEAERTGAELIVLGGHARPRLRDAIFGTVGTHVAQHGNVPLLVVQTDPALPYTKLMVAADAPETAPRLVENALAIAPKAEIFAVHAFTAPLGAALFRGDAVEDEAGEQDAALRAALARVASAHPRTLLDAHGHVIVEEGDPLTVMMDMTEQLVPDLVVMGSHHRGTFIGSRGVDAMFWCPADLLIVPEPALALAGA